jgi:hypothetical protein
MARATVPRLDDPRTLAARRAAADVLKAEHDFDTRYELLRQISVRKFLINGEPISAVEAYDPRQIAALGDLLRRGNPLVVGSWTEDRRITNALGKAPPNVTRALTAVTGVPRWEAPFGGDHIVVWAPKNEPWEMGLVAFGFEDLHIPAYVVCRHPEDAAELRLRATFIDVAAALTVLKRALAVVVGDITDPAAALALARSGVPLAIASTSGSHEYLDGAPIYSPWNARSIRGATLVAMSSRPPRVRRARLPVSPLEHLRNLLFAPHQAQVL